MEYSEEAAETLLALCHEQTNSQISPKYVHSSLGDSCSLFYLLPKYVFNLTETCTVFFFRLTDFPPLGCLSFKRVLKE